jgi:hypothetical protein
MYAELADQGNRSKIPANRIASSFVVNGASKAEMFLIFLFDLPSSPLRLNSIPQ